MPLKLHIKCGDTFGDLRIVSEAAPVFYKGKSKRRYTCICRCGRETTVPLGDLRSGASPSCGKCTGATVAERLRYYTGETNAVTGCINWTGFTNANGYGVMNVRGKLKRSHRVAYELHHGKPIPAGKLACHKCNNPSCINPNHIYLGGYQDNANDRVRAGRQAKGSTCSAAKLSESDVARIRQLLATSERQSVIATRFDVKPNTISNIKTGRCWGHGV
jgi:hypothetical protein